jgi:hypothetical protein
MEPDLPPELSARRDELHARVLRRGRSLRRRRAGAIGGLLAVLLAVPATVVAVGAAGEGTDPRVETLAPGVTEAVDPTTTTVAPTTTTVAPPTTTSVPAGDGSGATGVLGPDGEIPAGPGPAAPPDSSVPPATTPACRNSTDPACGPFRYDPTPTNEPATIEVTSVNNAMPHPGEVVAITVFAADPDAVPIAECGIGVTFGDGESEPPCLPGCVAPGYGPWDPPPPEPGEEAELFEHAYAEPGIYTVTFTVHTGGCSPYASEATASITINVGGIVESTP